MDLPLIPIELIIEMGKYDIWLYQQIRMLSKQCYRELKNFNPVGTILQDHYATDYTFDNESNHKFYNYHMYCPIRELIATGFVDIKCGYSYDRRYRCKCYIKRTCYWQTDGTLWTVEYANWPNVVNLEYDALGRLIVRQTRHVRTFQVSFGGDIKVYEIMWPKTGNVRMRFDYPKSCHRELYRSNGTLKYTEDRHDHYRVIRFYYDKSGTKIVARNEYIVTKDRKYECVSKWIANGWH